MGWIDVNFGIWLYDYFHHDETYILVDGAPVYASIERRRQNADMFQSRAELARPLLDEVRERASAGYIDPPFASDFVVIEGRPAIISVSPIVSDTGNIMQPPRHRAVLVSIIHLDMDYELRLIEKYQLEAGRFTSAPWREPKTQLAADHQSRRPHRHLLRVAALSPRRHRCCSAPRRRWSPPS